MLVAYNLCTSIIILCVFGSFVCHAGVEYIYVVLCQTDVSDFIERERERPV